MVSMNLPDNENNSKVEAFEAPETVMIGVTKRI